MSAGVYRVGADTADFEISALPVVFASLKHPVLCEI